MKVIVIANQKGGAGKTTHTRSLAVAATLAGAGPVAIVDGDPQGSLKSWWETRPEEDIALFQPHLGGLPAQLAEIAPHFGLCIIDTPPQAGELIRTIVALADLVVVPIQASPDDLWAVGDTLDILDQAGKRFIFCLNRAKTNARVTASAMGTLSEHAPVCRIIFGDRVGHLEAATQGRTLQETAPKSKGADEIARYWEYVAAQLEISKPRKRK